MHAYHKKYLYLDKNIFYDILLNKLLLEIFMAKNKFYAYYITTNKDSGITESWGSCSSIIKGQSARYKGFVTKADAIDWLASGASYEKAEIFLEPGVYFDAGTGRGIGVEVRVTDENGVSLVDKVVPQDKINEFGNYLTKEGSTNNFGELLGCYIALKIALKEKIYKIFGDSKLIIDYWSKGHIKREQIAEETVKLSDSVKLLRKDFEAAGGSITHISGDINPADLGFH